MMGLIMILSATIFYLNVRLQQANDTIEELRTGRTNRPGEYLLPVRPGIYQHFMDLINNTPPPPSPDHYSVGGTTPHLCVCGKPIKEHR